MRESWAPDPKICIGIIVYDIIFLIIILFYLKIQYFHTVYIYVCVCVYVYIYIYIYCSGHHDKSSYHLSPYKVTPVVLTILLMLYISPLRVINNIL